MNTILKIEKKHKSVNERFISANLNQIKQVFPAHSHDFFEIELIESGTGYHILNGQRKELRPGEIYFLTPDDVHAVFPKNNLKLYNIMFSEDFLSGEPSFESVLSCHGEQISLDDLILQRILPLIEQLCRESKDKETYSLEYMQGLFRCIFILLLRANNSQSNSEQKYGELHNAVFYIRRHFRENISLADVAKYTSLSKNYFCERFRAVIGIGFNAYLNNLRTDYSAHLLSDTNESIIDICYESGFSSFSSFSRLFKTKYGITPSEYRKIKKKNRSL